VTEREHAVEAVASMWLSVYFHAECYEFWNSERLAVPPKAMEVRTD